MKKIWVAVSLSMMVSVFILSAVPVGAADKPFPEILYFGTGGVGGECPVWGSGLPSSRSVCSSK